MDPLTQGTLGAALPQSVARRESIGLAMLAGLLGGMAPDLDVLVRSPSDPLLFLEYHRQFTHSLIFIPFGGGLVGSLLWSVWGRQKGWSLGLTMAYAILGYATHALLDACTTYGTQLLWPFSNQRFAWNNVSIIDPLLTVPLIAGIVLSRLRRQRWPAQLGMAWVLGYLTLGAVLRDEAIAAGVTLAKERGHNPEKLEAKPSFANIVLWKTVYREGDEYFVDAVNVLFGDAVYPGESVPALDLARDFPWLDPTSTQARDVERFRWFSNGYLAADPQHPNRIMDLRYSLLPNEIRPLWSIELNPQRQHSHHVMYRTHREPNPELWSHFGAMLRGTAL